MMANMYIFVNLFLYCMEKIKNKSVAKTYAIPKFSLGKIAHAYEIAQTDNRKNPYPNDFNLGVDIPNIRIMAAASAYKCFITSNLSA